jgi:hypothetical protein
LAVGGHASVFGLWAQAHSDQTAIEAYKKDILEQLRSQGSRPCLNLKLKSILSQAIDNVDITLPVWAASLACLQSHTFG